LFLITEAARLEVIRHSVLSWSALADAEGMSADAPAAVSVDAVEQLGVDAGGDGGDKDV